MKLVEAFEPLPNLETSVNDLYELCKEKSNAITIDIVSHKIPRLLKGMNPEVAELYEKRQKTCLSFVKKTTSLKYQEI